MAKLEYTLEVVNQRLKASHVKVWIFQRGSMLWMKATLPPKPNSDKPRPYRQAISLGVSANEAGLKRAENEARLLDSRLKSNCFDWRDYIDSDRLPENRSAKYWIEAFKKEYFKRNALTEGTWKGDWEKIYKRLPPDEPVTPERLYQLVDRTVRNTRNRRETCRKLQSLADFIGLKVDLLQYKGNYGASKVEDRDIPSDLEILRGWHQIPNSAWRWVYGMMATFGLRDHEVFFCEWCAEDEILVTKGKTGTRIVFKALYPEWIEEFNLRTVIVPKIQDIDRVYADGKLGDKVSKQFRRYGIPFPPYTLRHAYAIRASVMFELPVTTAAALMGHSPKIHLEKYHKHISLKQNREAADRSVNRENRPQPPQITDESDRLLSETDVDAPEQD